MLSDPSYKISMSYCQLLALGRDFSSLLVEISSKDELIKREVTEHVF